MLPFSLTKTIIHLSFLFFLFLLRLCLFHLSSLSVSRSLPVIDLLVLWTLIFPASCPVDLVYAIKLLRGQAESFVI